MTDSYSLTSLQGLADLALVPLALLTYFWASRMVFWPSKWPEYWKRSHLAVWVFLQVEVLLLLGSVLTLAWSVEMAENRRAAAYEIGWAFFAKYPDLRGGIPAYVWIIYGAPLALLFAFKYLDRKRFGKGRDHVHA